MFPEEKEPDPPRDGTPTEQPEPTDKPYDDGLQPLRGLDGRPLETP